MDLRGKQYVNVKNLYFLAASMTLGNANNCIIDGCKFKYVAHNDVPPSYEMGTTFEIHQDCGDGHLGVYISGKNNLFENCSVTGSSASGIVIGGSYNTITNCRVSACDYAVTYHAGILVQKRYYNDPADAVGLDISHNSLSFNCRANLQVGSAATPSTAQDRLKIEYNDFGAACYTTTETGSIAAQSSYEVEVSHNWFHDVAFPGVGSIVMESDFGARGWIVHHNVFWQGKGGPVEGFRRGFDWTFTWDDPYGKCFNNTVVDSTDRLHWDWEYLNNGTPYPGLVANIIFAKDDTAHWKFTDPVNRDYSLRTGSPAIDAGVVVPGFVDTYNGSAPDLGAYEFGQPRWVAGANWQDAAWTYPPSTQSVGRFPVAGNRLQTALRLASIPGRILIYSQPRTAGTIAVFGVSGRRIAATPLQLSGCTAVDVRSVPGAIYFVKCMLPGETFVWKIVKE
jgi:parallel beta-helix repeat protein